MKLINLKKKKRFKENKSSIKILFINFNDSNSQSDIVKKKMKKEVSLEKKNPLQNKRA